MKKTEITHLLAGVTGHEVSLVGDAGCGEDGGPEELVEVFLLCGEEKNEQGTNEQYRISKEILKHSASPARGPSRHPSASWTGPRQSLRQQTPRGAGST